MGFMRIIAGAALALAPVGAPAADAVGIPAPEPLVVTQLADPDPNYRPPLAEGSERNSRDRKMPALDAAMQDFGRAIGEAALLQQRAIEAKCGSGAPVPADGAARWAWEANCRYDRR